MLILIAVVSGAIEIQSSVSIFICCEIFAFRLLKKASLYSCKSLEVLNNEPFSDYF